MSLDRCRRSVWAKLFLCLLVIAPIRPAQGAVEPDTVWAMTGRGEPTFLSGSLGFLAGDLPLGDAAVLFADQFAAEVLGSTGAETFEVLRVDRDLLGQAHIHLAQRIDGIRVPGADRIVHVDEESREVLAMNGRWVSGAEVPPRGAGDPEVAALFSPDSTRRLGTDYLVDLDRAAADRILDRVRRFYRTPGANAADQLAAVRRAAADLFGAGSAEVAAVRNRARNARTNLDTARGPIDFPVLVFIDSDCSGLVCTLQASFSEFVFVDRYIWSFPGGSSQAARPEFFFPGYDSHMVFLTVQFTRPTGSGGFASGGATVDLQPAAPISPRVGSWFNPERNGNGIDVYRTTDGRLGLGWYTYLADGTPIWYSSSIASPSGAATWNASLRKFTWNGSSATSTVVGDVRLDLSNPAEAWFSWTLNGQSGGERFEFLFGGEGRSGAWFAPSEPGWGLQVEEQAGTLGGVVTFFEGSQPRWVSGTASAGSAVDVALRWRTGLGLCPACSGGSVSPPPGQAAGSLRLQVANGSSTSGTLTTAITTPGGSTWNRGPVAIQLLTAP